MWRVLPQAACPCSWTACFPSHFLCPHSLLLAFLLPLKS